ncbi:aromatic ring-hydroxylating dioxygenase subunit alpha [uncultured Paraglaciecola sp.]|uniref:aromatic ring-hydroxylating oxygenase subunit alpha n=1 Tax=uncultured Paraglaciecola sp. TaxID=1765024 RepID=UPI002639CE8C|nr:aromatic ring-hydroxylating dioxygenase subunit alpha [uncultured Paraglaciecola sp.]
MKSISDINLENASSLKELMTDTQVIERIFAHLDNKTTDMGRATWREPTEHYGSEQRFKEEYKLLEKTPLMLCPSAAIPEYGSYTTRDVQGVPLVVVRDKNGQANVFRNACRHRGVKVASGSGRKKAFVCPYHAWTYDVDGTLKVIPHEHGFPQINKCDKSLVAVKAIETQGLIFVCLDQDNSISTLDNLPELVPQGYRLYDQSQAELSANWKTILESFLEGYHIKATHPKSFFPVQYDNMNVIEHFGPHNRVCYPYRSVEKLRERPQPQWLAENRLTYVYQLFPNVIVSTHPGFRVITSIEPVAANKTIQSNYVVTNVDTRCEQKKQQLDAALALANSSIDEDRAMIFGAQAGLAAKANQYLEFGLFESAIVHFHSTLKKMLEE